MGGLHLDRRQILGAACGAASLASVGARAQSGKPQRVDVVMTQGFSGLVVHEVAKAKGFFSDFNLDPNLLLVTDGAKCVAAVLSGAAKLCIWSGFPQLLPAIEKGADVKIVAGALVLPSMCLYSGQPDVKTVKDLEGKVIGIGSPGSVLHQMTVLVLQKKGVDLNKVTFRNVGTNDDIFKAIVAKTVDAGLAEVDVFDKQAFYHVHNLPDGMTWKELPDYANQASYATEAAIRADRDLLVRVLAAYAKAYRYVSTPQSRDDYIRGRKAVTGSSDPSEAITMWNWIQHYKPYDMNLTLTNDQIDFVQKANVEFKAQKNVLPAGSISDMTLAQDALKMLA